MLISHLLSLRVPTVTLATHVKLLAHYAKGTPLWLKCARFCLFSLPNLGLFFSIPLRYLFTIGQLQIFAERVVPPSIQACGLTDVMRLKDFSPSSGTGYQPAFSVYPRSLATTCGPWFIRRQLLRCFNSLGNYCLSRNDFRERAAAVTKLATLHAKDMPQSGFEPLTSGFSVLRSTPELLRRCLYFKLLTMGRGWIRTTDSRS